MTVYTWLWLAVGAAALTIEFVALLNSTKGDTLSEHVWAWLGVRQPTRGRTTYRIPQDDGGPDVVVPPLKMTPRWTLRLARCVLIFGMVWLLLHFTTGGWV